MDQVYQFWLNPRQTIEILDQEDSQKVNQKVNLILSLLAILFCLQGYCVINFPDNSEKALKAMYTILAIPFVFLIAKFFYSFLLLIFSKLFQGKSTFRQIQYIFAYATSPFLIFLPYVIFQFFVVLTLPNPSVDSVFTLTIERAFSILTLCYLIIGLTKVNKFSAGYGLAVAILVPSVIELLRMLFKS